MAESLVTQVARDDAPPARKPKLALPIASTDEAGTKDAAAIVPMDDEEDYDEKEVKTVDPTPKPGSETETPRSVGRTIAQSPRAKGAFTIPTLPATAEHEETAGEDLPGSPKSKAAATSSAIGSPKSAAVTRGSNKTLWQIITSCFQSDIDIDAATSGARPEKAPADPSTIAPPETASEAPVAEGLLGPNKTDKRYCLVLDLDETLVHSSFKPVAHSDFILSIEMDGITHKVYVAKRPGVDEFLEEMAKHYELVIFTASLDKYANPLLDLLDPKKLITGRLFREHCTKQGQLYIKDLGRLGRPLDRTLIIDNSPHSYAMHMKWAVPILSWFDDPKDEELLEMIPYLVGLTKIKNVSEILDASKPWRVCQRKLLRVLQEKAAEKEKAGAAAVAAKE